MNSNKNKGKNRIALAMCFFLLLSVPGISVQAAESQADISFSVSQEIQGEDAQDMDEREITYSLISQDSENPMPQGSREEKYSFGITGNGEKEIGPLTFAHAGVYTYKLESQALPEGDNLEAETESYTLQVYVKNTRSGLNASLVALLEDGNKSSDISFRYQYQRYILNISFPDLISYIGDSEDGSGFPSPRMTVEPQEGQEVNTKDLIFYFQDGTVYDPEIINEDKEYYLVDDALCDFVDSEGNQVNSDDGDNSRKLLTFALKEGVYAQDSRGTRYNIRQTPGNLEVKEISDETKTNREIVTPVRTAEGQVSSANMAEAVVPETSTYLVNNIENSVLAGNQVSLMFDNILPAEITGETASRMELLIDKVNNTLIELGENKNTVEDQNRMYQGKYLDLVDSADGNIWVTSTEGADIYWPYPQGTDKNTEFQLIHFTELHRGYTYTEEKLRNLISHSNVELMNIETTDKGIKFHSVQNGFSPFVLTWVGDSSSSESAKDGIYKSSTVSKAGKVKTGDQNQIILWILLAGAALTAAGINWKKTNP